MSDFLKNQQKRFWAIRLSFMLLIRISPYFFTRKDNVVSTLAIEAIGKGGFGGDLTIMVGVDLNAGIYDWNGGCKP